MVFAYVFIEGWIIDPYVYCFFYGSHEVLVLPSHYAEIFYSSSMTCGAVMVIYWGRGLQIFFEPLPKCSLGLYNILFITFHPVTFVSINYPTLFYNGVFVFGYHMEVFVMIW